MHYPHPHPPDRGEGQTLSRQLKSPFKLIQIVMNSIPKLQPPQVQVQDAPPVDLIPPFAFFLLTPDHR